MHYRPRRCSDMATTEELERQQRAERLAERDAAYRAALGVAIKDKLPAILGTVGHARTPRGGQVRDSRPGVSVPEARHGH